MNKQTTFHIPFTQYLDEDGQVVAPLPSFASDRDSLIELLNKMIRSRAMDHKAVAMQRTGKMGTYPEAVGQEAFSAGIAASVNDDDVYVCYYRDHYVLTERGIDPVNLLQYWGGDERGMAFDRQSQDMPICIPIATQCLHAAGIASAIKLRKEARAVIVTLGDGATSKGDFYEAINVAGAWQLPLVIIINNNQWAISVAREKQSGAQTLAQKGIAAGISSEQIDGNDVVAVTHAVQSAIEKARSNKGPHLIEAITYRLCNHTTADDFTRYVAQDDIDDAWTKEPIARLFRHLEREHGYTAAQMKQLEGKANEDMASIMDKYLNITPQPPESMFEHLFETLPEALNEQRQELIESLDKQSSDRHD